MRYQTPLFFLPTTAKRPTFACPALFKKMGTTSQRTKERNLVKNPDQSSEWGGGGGGGHEKNNFSGP